MPRKNPKKRRKKGKWGCRMTWTRHCFRQTIDLAVEAQLSGARGKETNLIIY